MPTSNNIYPGFPGPYTTAIWTGPDSNDAAYGQLTQKAVATSEDLECLKDVVNHIGMKESQHDREIYEIREEVKEALAIVKYPGLIANRVLDKIEDFIESRKKAMTTPQGLTTEVLSVSELRSALKTLREVVKNGN